MMFGGGRFGALRIISWDGRALLGRILRHKIRIESAGTMGQHGGEISMDERAGLPGSSLAGLHPINTVVLGFAARSKPQETAEHAF
jgi:hypothetical protein